MKALLIAAGVLALGVGTASAEPWSKGHFPYPEAKHAACQRDANRLHEIEIDIAAHAGRRSVLKAEMDQVTFRLDHDCNHWRWHG